MYNVLDEKAIEKSFCYIHNTNNETSNILNKNGGEEKR